MATAMDENYSRENGLNDTAGLVLTSSTSKKSDFDEIPDYNEAFPQLISAGHLTTNRSTTFFSSPFPSSSSNGNNSTGAMTNTTTSLYSTTKNDEERRRKLAIHASSVTTKIIEIPPSERASDKSDNSRRGGNQSSRNTGANNNGQTIQKLCTRIQKETSTNMTFFYKDQTLILTITGRPEQVRSAQVQILREIQKPVNLAVNVPWDFHKFIIGPRGTTLKTLEQETLTRITVPPQESQSNFINVSGAKDNVKLCEQRILDLYHTQLNKGFERLSIPYLYHPWIRFQLVDQLSQQLKVTVDLPPSIKQTDEITIKGEREPVEQAKAKIIAFYKSLEGKIMTFPLEIPCEQHRFILGKKGAGIREIFDKTNVFVRIPNQEENSSTIQIMGETAKIGEAITMIYKMANALTAVQINAPRWMHGAVKGDRSAHLENFRKSYPDVRIYFREDHISLEGPPEDVERVRSQIQTAIDELKNKNTTYAEVEIDPQYYKQLIGKSQARLLEMQEQTGCDIKFPFNDDERLVKLMGTKENVEKARQLLIERAKKLANERTTDLSIDPQYYPQIIGAKGKNLEEVRSKFNNIQITFPDASGKSDKVTLHGDKDDVEKCSKFLQQRIKDLYSTELDVPKRLYPMLIGKGGSNIKSLREKTPDVRIDVPSLEDNKESTHIRLSGKKADVDKARKMFEEYINQLNTSIENSIEQHITIDSKWHNKFFQNKRKLLTDLQQQYGDMLIKLPERNTNSDQVLLRGTKENIEQVRKRLEELVDTWENTVTKEMTIPHRHHGYLLAQGGAYIQPVQKEYNVQIKFPPRGNNTTNNNQKDEQQQQQQEATTTATAEDENQKDIVRITGRSDDVDKAMIALEKMIPVETTVDIPCEAHGSLVGKGGSNVQALIKQYPDVQVTFPPQNSTQNNIQLKGQGEQVESVRKELLDLYEKFQADRQARSFEVRFTIKPEDRSVIFGYRGKTLNSLRTKYDVKIDVSNNNPTVSSAVVPTPTNDNDNQPSSTVTTTNEQQDDQQATPQETSLSLPNETSQTNPSSDVEVVITGYEDKALACRDEILQTIKDFQSKITMEIEIDPRIHARIIGSGGSKLQQIQKEYSVEIKFQANNQNDKVHVIGLDQDKIDACIDHLLILEEDYIQDLPYRPLSTNTQTSQDLTLGQQLTSVQEVPTNNNTNTNNNSNNNKPSNRNDNKNKQNRQAPFQVKNAPWTNGNEHENDYQQKNSSRKRNENSPKKAMPLAPKLDDLGEYPSFSNGLSLTSDEASSQVHQTTVNPVPVIWGPQKRNN